ncbi:hypothetical protein HPB51_016415 [Rhipicephalus microplus]|uniref:Uncharacterized protein n=1 Tax=Rhipicephalus microplus TaxID=6941 RepID=A0A9J6EBA2_RHIMP|nr:hypothetical protein HPB51_016415 [Rhipicephalus microplus]
MSLAAAAVNHDHMSYANSAAGQLEPMPCDTDHFFAHCADVSPDKWEARMRTLVVLHADLLQYQEDVIADRNREIEELRIQLHKVAVTHQYLWYRAYYYLYRYYLYLRGNEQPKRQRLNSPSPEAAAQRTEECSRQLRLLEETKTEAQQPHREFKQEVRDLRSSLERVAAAGERIAAALDLLVGALVPGHVMAAAPPNPPPPSP